MKTGILTKTGMTATGMMTATGFVAQARATALAALGEPIPAAAENDCNLAALAELSFAEAEANQLRDFVFLEIGDVGVGGSILINRALYRGHDLALSAEFGHMVVESDGPNCSCGRRG